MKVCSYCGTENPNNAVICENCGAHEFKHKCNNCGTIYAEGEYCPKCGVKAGQRPRVCPNCGREYYSNACPTCGYVKGSKETAEVRTRQSAERSVSQSARTTMRPTKKRKTWLWVLGWIFIFPLPLTILLMRNQKMNKVVKIAIIAIAWLFYLLIAFSGGSGSSNNSTKTDGALPVTTETPTQPTEETAANNESTGGAAPSAPISKVEEVNNPYVDLDAFIDDFNAMGGIQITSHEQIDIHDKSGGYYRTEFRLNAFNNAIAYHVIFEDGSSADLIDTAHWSSGETVNGSIDRIYVLASSKESFESIFRTACKAMHPDTITDADVDAALDEMMHPYRYEEMEYLYSSGSGVIGSRNEGYTYSIKEKTDYYDFFLD